MSILQVVVGENKGRVVGANRRVRSSPELRTSPEVPVPGTGCSLYIQREEAFHFIEANALSIKEELLRRGVETEVIPG
jgi:hypothetical protein